MSLSEAQVDALLRPINPKRVLSDNKGMAHVSQQDVRAHLTRIFGFGGWSSEVLDLTCIREAHGVDSQGKDKRGWDVTYRATVRLTVRDPDGHPVASYEDVATGTSPNLPTIGDGHDFASKVAVSMALKRAATCLGDGFGLSLYNKGQLAPLVIGTLVHPGGKAEDAQDQVPTQTSLGHDDAGSSEAGDTTSDIVSLPTAAPELPVSALPETADPVLPLDSEQVSAHTAAQVAHLREKVIAALQQSKREAAKILARLQVEAAQGKLMNEPTHSPLGEPMTVNLLLDNALKHLARDGASA